MIQPIRRQYSFIGRVQGVGFRATARSIARGFPVTGWVRNEPDNSVVLQVQGQEGDVAAFAAELLGVMARHIDHSAWIAVQTVEGEGEFVVRR